MTRFKEVLAEYGVDPEITMPRFANDEALYMRCFGLFMRDDNLAKLKDALSVGDYETAFLAAHTLKGVTANMGFEAMYDAVCALVEPLRVKDPATDYDALYRAVCAEADKIKELKAKADLLR